jgi:phosphatidylglycerol:prolipoprotein diacylglycerol transferase
VGTPLNTPLHPTQIYLSLNAFVIFLVLQWAYRRKTFDGEVFWLYVLLYSITRGIIEVWRGDLVRGFVIPGVLSTSQFIGVLAALASLAMLFYLSRREREAIQD